MGPLQGLKVIEFGGIGPGPFCAALLSDMGAEVISIDRRGQLAWLRPIKYNTLKRGRRSLGLNLDTGPGREIALRLIEKADVSVEGFRPGVMERLGLGPEDCLARNPGLIYGRMTGWGREGPLAGAAGHDINYLALSGALHAIGPADSPPPPPLNLVADFGGGGMLLAFGLMAALWERERSGKGQVVDAAMLDGCALLMSSHFSMFSAGLISQERGTNLLDGGAHFYATYRTRDGKYIALGPTEPRFYALLLEKAGVEDPELAEHWNREAWPLLKERMAGLIASRTRAEWRELLEGSDVCFAPVLNFEEALTHPHNRARGVFVEPDGVAQAAPAPRFSRTKAEIQAPPVEAGTHTLELLAEYGYSPERVAELLAEDTVFTALEEPDKENDGSGLSSLPSF